MVSGFLAAWRGEIDGGVVASPVGENPDDRLEFFQVGHPVPTSASFAAGLRVLERACGVPPDGVLLVLLSGGASASLAVPLAGLTLEDKVLATDVLLRAGVAIDRINCVRKHLSAIKGGRLAEATPGTVVTLAVSDVVGPVADDPAVIGSGPTVSDPTTFDDARRVIERISVDMAFPERARAVIDRGCRGEIPETPKPGSPCLGRSSFRVIGGCSDAIDGAARAARELGYGVAVIDEPIVGEARRAARTHHAEVLRLARGMGTPACVVSAGETTVTVRGSGRGGRNQEFALALVELVANTPAEMVVASVGTDGVDGPTDAAGAIVDRTTLRRSRQLGMDSPAAFLANNDSYPFFDGLHDLIRTGPTDTNIGDLQIVLIEHADS